ASTTGDVKDIRPDNDSLLTEITIALSDMSEPGGTDGSGTPATPRKTESDTSASGSSSGGGGGAMHWVWLLLGLAGAGMRRRSLA
ncbi:MAG TPA: GlyGly-CTERM sorting domain-containing protein, partial [Marinobacter sp.]